jgi:hypothetical protein
MEECGYTTTILDLDMVSFTAGKQPPNDRIEGWMGHAEPVWVLWKREKSLGPAWNLIPAVQLVARC